jgi:hypothetical protein
LDLLFVKPLETILDASPLKPWHNSRPMATKALNDVSGRFAIFLGTVNVFDLLLKESLLFVAQVLLWLSMIQAAILSLESDDEIPNKAVLGKECLKLAGLP